jgi:hypothetical protein
MTHEAATTVKELPEALPAGETILLQCAPNWRSLYRRAFHGRSLAIYFGVLILLRGATSLANGGSSTDALIAMAWLVPAAVFALAVLALLAWLTARASWYTITDKRIVMRIGIVLEVTYNFPFEVIDSVGLHLYPNGTGDLPMQFMEGEQIAYAHLWPHARPWRLRRTEPMLRCIDNASSVAALLARVMPERSGGSLHAVSVPQRASASPRAQVSQPTAAAMG